MHRLRLRPVGNCQGNCPHAAAGRPRWVLAELTGVAACNISGVPLRSSLLLPVINESYGKAYDVPLPRGEQLLEARRYPR